MNLDERLRSAANDIAEVHRRRPVPTLRRRSPVPRWAAAAVAVSAVVVVFLVLAPGDQTPVDPATSTTVTPDSTSTTTGTSEPTTTTIDRTTTTTTGPPPEQSDVAWTPTEAERMVDGYLAALADGQWAIAAFSMENGGIPPDGGLDSETPTEFLERSCSPNLCVGPYDVSADGPGLVDPETLQAASTVTVTHLPSGETGTIRIATFEGAPVIADLPPLIPGDLDPLARSLFEGDLPDDVVFGRFEAVERWSNGLQTWRTQWLVDQFVEVDGGVALVYEPGPDRYLLTPIDSPERSETGACPSLLGVGVIPFEGCPTDVFGPDGESVPPAQFEPFNGEDPGFRFYAERNGVRMTGLGDAEGNMVELTVGSVDILGNDYASLPRLSPDGSRVAYVDHADDRAESHFWSTVVVVKDTATGQELNRIAFDAHVLWLQFDGTWVVTGGRNADYAGGDPYQQTIGTFNVETGAGGTIESPVRVWLP